MKSIFSLFQYDNDDISYFKTNRPIKNKEKRLLIKSKHLFFLQLYL